MRFLLLLNLTGVSLITAAWAPPSYLLNPIQRCNIQPVVLSRERNHGKTKIQPAPLIQPSCRFMAEEDLNESIQNEIEEMKLEALKKLNDLDYKISSSSKNSKGPEIDYSISKSSNDAPPERIPRKNPSVSLPLDPLENNLTLLSGTEWKIALNIGREQGTWMPDDWGVSGGRLIINMEIDFTGEQLYEREGFLGGLGGARILKVKDNQMTLAPSISEGIKKVKATEGGWRVAKGQGPMGTDILRFYVTVEEQISRGDVYCPAGRIYCNCGYFLSKQLSSGKKERHLEELDLMEKNANRIEMEIEEEASFFSLDKIKKSSELARLRAKIQKTAEMYAIASVIEPDKSILKFSNAKDLGLTKEGGVCCKVEKAMGDEYHILGRFSIAPIES